MSQNSSAYMARVVSLQTDAVVVTETRLKLASFKADQRPYRSSALNHVGAAVFDHVARSGRLDTAYR